MIERPEKTGEGLLLELLDLLKVSEEQARELERSTKRFEEHSDAVQETLARAMYRLNLALNGSRFRSAGAYPRLKSAAETEPRLKRFAKPVSSLAIHLRADKPNDVSIDESEPLKLSARLTDLLIFAASGRPGPDGIASHRSIAEAGHALGATRHSVSNLVYRLRHELDRHDWNPYLVETSDSPRSNPTLRFRTRQIVVIDNS